MTELLMKSRQRNSSKAWEHYILVKNSNGGIIYNGWYSLHEIVNFPECPLITSNSVGERLKKVGDNLRYKSAWEAITAPRIKAVKNQYEIAKAPIVREPGFYAFIKVNNLWPTGSLAHTVI